MTDSRNRFGRCPPFEHHRYGIPGYDLQQDKGDQRDAEYDDNGLQQSLCYICGHRISLLYRASRVPRGARLTLLNVGASAIDAVCRIDCKAGYFRIQQIKIHFVDKGERREIFAR